MPTRYDVHEPATGNRMVYVREQVKRGRGLYHAWPECRYMLKHEQWCTGSVTGWVATLPEAIASEHEGLRACPMCAVEVG